ncbi:hypothetical protein LINPERHAP2_LOCUS37883 [Linum perenne]
MPRTLALMAVQRQTAASRSASPLIKLQQGCADVLPMLMLSKLLSTLPHTPNLSVSMGQFPFEEPGVGVGVGFGLGVAGVGVGFGLGVAGVGVGLGVAGVGVGLVGVGVGLGVAGVGVGLVGVGFGVAGVGVGFGLGIEGVGVGFGVVGVGVHWKLDGAFLPHALRSKLRDTGILRLVPRILALMAVQRQTAASRSASPLIKLQQGLADVLPILILSKLLSTLPHTPNLSASMGQFPFEEPGVGVGLGVVGVGVGFGLGVAGVGVGLGVGVAGVGVGFGLGVAGVGVGLVGVGVGLVGVGVGFGVAGVGVGFGLGIEGVGVGFGVVGGDVHWKPDGAFLPHALRSKLRDTGILRLVPRILALMAVQRQTATSRSASPLIKLQQGWADVLPILILSKLLSTLPHTPNLSTSMGQFPFEEPGVGVGLGVGVAGVGVGFGLGVAGVGVGLVGVGVGFVGVGVGFGLGVEGVGFGVVGVGVGLGFGVAGVGVGFVGVGVGVGVGFVGVGVGFGFGYGVGQPPPQCAETMETKRRLSVRKRAKVEFVWEAISLYGKWNC